MVEQGLRRFASACTDVRIPSVSERQLRVYNRSAWRYLDGTFMPEHERQALVNEIAFEEYEGYATGGRARAGSALRARDGTFLPTHNSDEG